MTIPLHPPKAPFGARFWIGICLLAGITAGMQMGKSPIGVAAVRTDFDLTIDLSAWIISAFPLLGAFSAVLLGEYARQFGPKRALLAGQGLLAASSLLCSISPTYLLLLAGRAGEGVGFLLITVAAPTLINAYASTRDRRLAMVLWSACIPIGIAATLLIGPVLVAPFGWRGLWCAGGIQTACLAIVAACSLPADSSKPRLTVQLAGVTSVIRRKEVLLLSSVAAAYMFLFSSTALFPVMFVDRFALHISAASELAAPVIIAGLIGGLIARRLLDAGIARSTCVLMSAASLGVAGFAIFGVPQSFFVVYSSCFVFATCAGILPAIVYDGAVTLAPSPSVVPIWMGMIMQANNLGVLAGPVAIGSAIRFEGWLAVGGVLAAACAILAITALALRVEERTRSAVRRLPLGVRPIASRLFGRALPYLRRSK